MTALKFRDIQGGVFGVFGFSLFFAFCLFERGVFGSQYDRNILHHGGRQGEARDRRTLQQNTLTTRSRVLIVSVDNRDLQSNFHANSYPSMTAVLNYNYALYQGYDFMQLENNSTFLIDEVNAKYADHNVVPPTNNAKDAATAFHVGLKQFRAASWAKLPPLWNITVTLGHKYDYIFYIDSDAAINPKHRDLSVDDILNKYSDPTSMTHSVLRGNPHPQNSTFVFFSNFPWRDDMPCAGSFLFRPQYAEATFREWWDFNLPIRNFVHFHEQDALWHMIDDGVVTGGKQGYKMNNKTFSILGERQFPSAWQPFQDLWLCHIASYNYHIRFPILNTMLKSIGRHDERRFAEDIGHVRVWLVHSLAVTEAMEKESLKDPNRIKEFPTFPENHYHLWWNEHVSSSSMEHFHPYKLHYGCLVRHKGEFWVLVNGTKRGFPNFYVFAEMGFDTDMALNMSPADLERIPTGDLFTTNVTENVNSLTNSDFFRAANCSVPMLLA